MKKKIGVFSFTCCEGCVIVFLETLNKKYFDWKDKLDFVNIRVLKKVTPAKEMEQLDIALVEGAVSTKGEIKKLKEIRKKSNKLVALGSGASTGYPSNQRNNFSQRKQQEIKPLLKKLKQIPKILPLKEFVKVDDSINSCPVEEDVLIKKIDEYIKEVT